MKPQFDKRDLFISPAGNDAWTGMLPQPNKQGTDGPLASLGVARDLLRERKAKAQLNAPVTVWMRGGRYFMHKPVIFRPRDSAPVTFAAYPGEKPVLDGGVRITNWRHDKLNDRPVWIADVGEILKKYPAGFRQFFVNGKRRPRPRLPKRDYFWMEDVPGIPVNGPFDLGSDYFKAAADDFQAWRNLADVDVMVMHLWSEERMPVLSYDPATRIVKSSRKSAYILTDDVGGRFSKYFVENVFEALTEPGEWYLDRPEGLLYYIPRAGERFDNTETVVPVLLQFIRIEGCPEEEQWVDFLTFRGLAFEYSDWIQPRGHGIRFNPYLPDHQQKAADCFPLFDRPAQKDVQYASGGQAAAHVPGSIFMEGARNCSIEECRIEHTGWYGIELADGCQGNRIVGNRLSDLGGGGIKVDGAFRDARWRSRSGNNLITDNHIEHAGEIFMSGVGIFLQHTFGNLVAHNHIHDLFYTGISCGFVWGYCDNVSRENRIEDNHIHNLGKGVLSDMGGIYILGIQPGTTIRGNLIHDVQRCNYGGWGIYPDEGSSHLVIENNICYNTASQTFHQHYGRENIVRNNIFAFGAEGLAAMSRGNRWNRRYVHCGTNIRSSLTMERNIFITDGEPVYIGALADATGNLENCDFISDLNLFWDVSGQAIVHGNGIHGKHGRENLTRVFDMPAWRKLGMDLHSIVADPLCRDIAGRDFSLQKGSPALALGFRPIDMSEVGPRPRHKRPDEPAYQLQRLDVND